jgi:serine protease
MKQILFICLVLHVFYLIAQFSGGEVGYMKEKELVFKIKPEFRDRCTHNDIKYPRMLDVFKYVGMVRLEKMFPLHETPRETNTILGYPLVDLSLIYKIEYDKDIAEEEVMRILMNTGLIEYAERVVIPELLYQPNDPLKTNQYYLSKIQAYQAWDICKGDTNYVIGIVDTGYDFTHLDLVGSVKYNYNDPIDGIDNDNDGYIDNYMGWNMGVWNNNPQWGNVGHGVHVSGIAGATPDNGYGIAGVGFHSKLLPVRVDDVNGVLTKTWEGLIYAADHGANVINCSWGSTFSNGQFGQDIINYATYNKGALVVAAAGNSNNERMFYPASFKNVLCVAATKSNDHKWENSSYYWRVDISAPGHDIYSTWPNGQFISSGGTSMAAPIVSGAAALIWSHYPQMLPQQISHIIKNSTDNIYNIGNNAQFMHKLGTGRINMYRALTDTIRPGISNEEVIVTDNNDQIFIMNDTLYISGKFRNFLAPTEQLTITLQCSSPFVELIDTVFSPGVLQTLEMIENHSNPFIVRIKENVPVGHQLTFFFVYNDTHYYGRDFFLLDVNNDYLNLDINQISTTVTSKSTIGYNDNINFAQGNGFSFQNSASLLSCAGLMIAQSTNKVSDNIYGFTQFVETDFASVQNVGYVVPPQKGDMHIKGIFKDNGPGSPQIGVTVIHEAYAFSQPEYENFIIVEFHIVNDNLIPLDDIYIGYFADWDLYVRSQNKALTNQAERFGYVFHIDSALFTSIQLLSEGVFRHYAIDNNGQDGSVNLNDGFSTVEKYLALTGNRTSAGNYQFGNNVSQIVSTGPFFIASGDTVTVAFGLHASLTYADMLLSTEHAKTKFLEQETVSTPELTKDNIKVFPNPFSNKFTVCSDPLMLNIIKVFDVTGRLLLTKHFDDAVRCGDIDMSKYKPGVYFVYVGENQAVKTILITSDK